MEMLIFVMLLAIANVHAADDDEIYCYGKDTERPQILHFASKTAYQLVKGTKMETNAFVPDCKPTKIWILHRHGTRLPSKSTIEKAPRLEKLRDLIVNNAQVKKSAPQLCNADILSLKVWKWNTSITPDMENYLTSQGYDDLRGTARQYQKIFGDVMPKEYNKTYYMFRHTDSQRTSESFKAFSEGLFGDSNTATAEELPDKDLLLRPYDYCTSWQEQNFKGPGSQTELFKKSSLWNSTLTEISQRLGFDYTMAEEDIMLMYDMCRYEQAWRYDRVSVWCAAFLAKHVSVFEFEEDLKYYYKSGYGFEENTKLNCRAVQDMVAHLNSTSLPGVVTYFAHSTAIETFLIALGINKDMDKLNSTSFNSMKNRKWQTSVMDPFASNFVAVKYYCPANTQDKNKVMFFLNQNAVDLDWCKVGLCDWSEVLKRYDPIIKANCDQYYCSSASAVSISSLIGLFMAVVVYLTN